MDLGTRALVLGVGALAVSWVPLINIVAFIAALMAVAFGLLARWPRPAATPSPFRQIWLDRAVTSGNLWLTAGLAMIALSFLLLLQP